MILDTRITIDPDAAAHEAWARREEDAVLIVRRADRAALEAARAPIVECGGVRYEVTDREPLERGRLFRVALTPLSTDADATTDDTE